MTGAAGPIAVQVPSWLEPHAVRFLANRRRDVPSILVAADAGDFAAMQRLGHNLKGAGGGFGFLGIGEIGRALEQAALAGDAGGLRAAASSLESYLDNLQVTYI